MGPTHLQQQKIIDYGFNSEDASEIAASMTGTGRAMRRLAGWFSRGHDRMTRMATWVKRRTLWSDGVERRGEKAVAILERQDQIRYVSPGVYSVQSQSQPGQYYTVKMTSTGRQVCDCPDHQYRKAQCKHILSVSALADDQKALAILDALGGDACGLPAECDSDGEGGLQKGIDDAAYNDSCKETQKRPKNPAKAKQKPLEKPDTEESKASQGKKKNGTSKKNGRAKKKPPPSQQHEDKNEKQKAPQEPVSSGIDCTNLVDQEELLRRSEWFEMPVDSDGNVHIYPVDEMRPPKCRHCPCTKLNKNGNQIWYVEGVEKKRQRYMCTACKKTFIYRAGLERMRCDMVDVADMCDHNVKGHSHKDVADTLKRRGKGRDPSSVGRTIKKYVGILKGYTSKIPLNKIGNRAHADEILVKIGAWSTISLE